MGTTPPMVRSGTSGFHDNDGVKPRIANRIAKAARTAPARTPAVKARFRGLSSGVEPALPGCARDARPRPAVSRHPHVELFLDLCLQDLGERPREDRLQLLVDLVLRPEERLQVLHP